MRIERLLVDGWMPFRHACDLELPAGPIAVVGETDGNARRSNWSGKTALLEAVTWCLFGVHRKRLDDGVISEGGPGCLVRLELGGLRVDRSRQRGKATVLVVEDGGESFRGEAAQQRVEARLGLSLEDYLATGCVRQGEAEAIVAMKPAQRREVISGWLGLGRWDDAGERAAQLSRAASEKVTRARAVLDGLRSQLATGSSFTELEDQEQGARDKLGELRLEREATGRSLDAARAGRSGAAAVAERNAKREVLRAELGSLREALAGRGAAQTALAEREAEHAGRSQTASQLRARADELRAIVDHGFCGQCPVTAGPCPVADEVEAAVQGAAGGAGDAEQAAETADGYERVAAAKVSASRKLLDQLGRQAERYNAVARALRELGPDEEPRGALQAAADFDQIEDAYRREGEQLVALEREHAALERDLAAQRGLGERVAKAEAELAALETAARVAALACRALGPRGVPARVARAGVGAVESQANSLLAGSGLSLEFAWSRETQEPAPSCEDCGYAYPGKRDKVCPQCWAGRGRKLADDLEVLVDDGSGQAPEDARAKSGGARLLVGSAVRLAAASLLRGTRGSQVGWALVDEPFGPLDAEHREQLARTFLGMLGAAGFEQALVVSHDAALLDAAPHRIVVERRGQVSAARVE